MRWNSIIYIRKKINWKWIAKILRISTALLVLFKLFHHIHKLVSPYLTWNNYILIFIKFLAFLNIVTRFTIIIVEIKTFKVIWILNCYIICLAFTILISYCTVKNNFNIFFAISKISVSRARTFLTANQLTRIAYYLW
jgi:hypothetical protein